MWVFVLDFASLFDIWDSVIDIVVRFFSRLPVIPLYRYTAIPLIVFDSLVELVLRTSWLRFASGVDR